MASPGTGGSGDDTFNFEGINTFTAVYGGAGNNTFRLSPTAHNLDNLSNILSLNGTGPGATGGSATLEVDDQANNLGAAWTLSGSAVVRIRTTPLLTAEEVDRALAMKTKYKAPGK